MRHIVKVLFAAILLACTPVADHYNSPLPSMRVPDTRRVKDVVFALQARDTTMAISTRNLPNESLICLYGKLDRKTFILEVTHVIEAKDYIATPSSITRNDFFNVCDDGPFLGFLHTHPGWTYFEPDVPICLQSAGADYQTFLVDPTAAIDVVLCGNGYAIIQGRSGNYKILRF
jgi:hypothetical protein